MPLSLEQKNLLPEKLQHLARTVVAESQSKNELMTLTALLADILPIIDQVSSTLGTHRVGYVSGVISGQGDDQIAHNLVTLGQWTETIRLQHDFPIFGPPDIFNQTMYSVLKELTLDRSEREPLFNDFWKSIITAKVTDVFMTPGWQSGKGTWIELKIAQEKGLQVHYYDNGS